MFYAQYPNQCVGEINSHFELFGLNRTMAKFIGHSWVALRHILVISVVVVVE